MTGKTRYYLVKVNVGQQFVRTQHWLQCLGNVQMASIDVIDFEKGESQ
jgi:hypothetical protein